MTPRPSEVPHRVPAGEGSRTRAAKDGKVIRVDDGVERHTTVDWTDADPARSSAAQMRRLRGFKQAKTIDTETEKLPHHPVRQAIDPFYQKFKPREPV